MSARDIFVIYNLAPNDNMKTHIKGVGFKTALNRFVNSGSADRNRSSLEQYCSFIDLLSDDPEVTDKIVKEMVDIYQDFAWIKVDPTLLATPTDPGEYSRRSL